MKKTTFSKIIALILSLAMVFSLAGCGGSDDAGGSAQPSSQQETVSGAEVTTADSLENGEMQYVLVYNPKIYDENAINDVSALKTGYFGSQIEVESNRGDGLDTENPYVSISQNELNKNVPWDKINLEGNRAENIGYDYNEGDEREFYTGMNERALTSFECVYAGEFCYVWSDGSGDVSGLKAAGEEFDKNVYQQVVDAFGTARFVGDSGKVNLLVYSLPDGYGGYFWIRDLFATSEVDQRTIEEYGVNTDHAIIHLNVNCLGTKFFFGTLAHEFQHLINGTNYFETVNEAKCSSWFDEAMSGYIEEQLYEGVQEEAGRYDSFNESGRIRKGQSMYNFDTTMEMYNQDIGVYGSVYYFAEYLSDLAGSDVFSKFHSYWRDSYSSTLCVAEALVNSVSSSYKNRVNGLISYPDALSFASEDEEFMSKMTLDFYLTCLSKDSDIKSFENIDQRSLLYDDLEEASIEGGGRILLKVKDGKFVIPEDSEAGLIYVGLDSNFNPVTNFVFK